MWKKIKDYEEYEINELGEVKRNEKILKHSLASNGYIHQCLCKNGKARTFRLHRLLAQAFIPNPENKPCINHIDGNRKNNSLNNLEWCTLSENMFHALYIIKTKKIERVMQGKFGKDHNVSKSFSIKFPNGEIKEYGSGLEFIRETDILR